MCFEVAESKLKRYSLVLDRFSKVFQWNYLIVQLKTKRLNKWMNGKKHFMAHFYRQGSTVSKLKNNFNETKGWALEPPSDFEPRTPRLRIQRLNHGTCTKEYYFVKILSHVYGDKTFEGIVSNWVLKFR